MRHSGTAKPDDDDRPLVIVEKVRGAFRIAHIDERAQRLGLRPGLTLADARACFPSLKAVDVDPAADAALLTRVVAFSDRFSPLVARDFYDGVMLDITGAAHLFGGEAPLRTRVIESLKRFGLYTRASIAGTPDAARALVRSSGIEIVPPGEDEALVGKLPVSAISNISKETVTALSRAGLKTIGAVASRPPAALAARFGQKFVADLARTLGREDIRIAPLRPLPVVITGRSFAEPIVAAEAIETILETLIEEAAQKLFERGEGGRAFEAKLFRSDGAVRGLAIETGRPTRAPKVLMRLFRERLQSLAEPLDAGFGFDCVRLAVVRTEPLLPEQSALEESAEDGDGAVAHLIDHLSVRFGRDRVLRFEALDSHDPTRASRLVPAAGYKAQTPAFAAPAHVQAQVLGEPPLRPFSLFEFPQPVEALAEVPDGPPRRFRWRRVLHDVVLAEGPERIAPEWWLAGVSASQRDYYRVEDSTGHRFWLFREGPYGGESPNPRWFIHGVFA